MSVESLDLWNMTERKDMPLIDLSGQLCGPPFQLPQRKVYGRESFSMDLIADAISEIYSMKKRVFQYMVLLHEYEEKEGNKEYKDSRVIIDLKTVMAKSEKELVFKITREIPEEYAGDPDNVEIIIRPF